jgi:hypothetical protein
MPRHPVRVVRDPDPPAPRLWCPQCNGELRFKQATYGGVSPEERWDAYDCQMCGSFEYRHRTRRIRRA